MAAQILPGLGLLSKRYPVAFTAAGPRPSATSGRSQRARSANATNDSTQPTPNTQPVSWKLMGRVVDEERIPFTQLQQRSLVISATANKMGLPVTDFTSRLQDLMALLPDMSDRITILQPSLLAALCADTSAVAQKLITLRRWFPSGNVSMMVMKRPSLLLNEEFDRVPQAASKLKDLFPGCNIDAMVSQQPLLLVEDIEDIIQELSRLAPKGDALRILQVNPDIVTAVMKNRNLSIW